MAIAFEFKCPKCERHNFRRVSPRIIQTIRCKDDTCNYCHLKVQVVFNYMTCLGCSKCDDFTYKTTKIPFETCMIK